MELQQSPTYQKYIKSLGWEVAILDGTSIYIRSIPFVGRLAKIQRPSELPYLPKLIPFLTSHHIQSVAFEAALNTNASTFQTYMHSLSKFFKIHKEPFLQTKSILIDIQKKESDVFNALSEAKRRAVRRAIKHNVIIKESYEIQDLISIKNSSSGMFGSITTYGVDKLWQRFAPNHASILIAYHNEQPVGGVLLLFHEHVSYYWIAGATKYGKKLFAPTLLVWEALCLSQKKGMKKFDFVGVFDERTPKQFKSWRGFTKFKEGFGGKEIYYPIIH
jgi:lipid II:glycine glycyltransferase (peptidoglycan interpeptide bridge formation enzyme)